MTATVADWTALPSETKLALIVDGFKADRSYAQMRDELGAPSNGAISSYVRRAREKGLLPPATRETLSQAGRLHARQINPGPATPPPARLKEAFNALPDVDPIPFDSLTNTTCKWPIDRDEPGFWFCGAPCEVEHSYCSHHRRLAYQPRRSSLTALGW